MSVSPQLQLNRLNQESPKCLDTAPAANMSNRMEHILQAMPSGIIIINGDGLVTEANPVAVELLGLPLEGLKWLQIINRAFSPRDDDGHEVSLKNGRRVKLAITPLTPEPGQLIVLTDLTETRLLQKNLSHLQRLSALGKMVATLAHQVRTPLTAALLYASNLASTKISAQSRARFQTKLVDRLNELEHQVNDMLLMAKGRGQDQGEAHQVSTIFDNVMANCEPIAEQHSCKLIRVDNSVSEFLANCATLSSAINNLVINGIEAGATLIELRGCETEHQIQIHVTDNGKGLDKGMQQKVLEPFFTTKPQGTGLGLAVVQSVVANHGGKMQLRCEKGKGCKASLHFPKLNISMLQPDSQVSVTNSVSAEEGLDHV